MAIAIAKEYNLRMRPETAPSVESLIRDSGGFNGEAKPFAEHVDRIMSRAIADENHHKAPWKTGVMTRSGERIFR
jgi:hypothetical protein